MNGDLLIAIVGACWLLLSVLTIALRPHCHVVRSMNDGFDWGCYAVKWRLFGRLMLLWSEHPDRFDILWFTGDTLDEFAEGIGK